MAENPNTHVEILSARKRGEWYTVEGTVGGKKASVDIPAEAVEKLSRKEGEALMRRGVFGTVQQERER